MIVPESRSNRSIERVKAMLSTFILAGLCYGVLSMGGISLNKSARKTFREVDLAGLGYSAPLTVHAEMLPGQPIVLSRVERAADSISLELDQPMQEAVAQEAEGQSGVRNGSVSASIQRTGNSSIEPEDQVATQAPSVNNEEAEVGNTPLKGNERLSSEIQGKEQRRSINENESNVPVIERLSMESLGDNYSSLEIQSIVGWIKENRSTLPEGIRQLVRHRPAFLSSAARFIVDGKQYELYFMCKESLLELHIVLVDDKNAIYLVDRSFQKLSNYLRKGQVLRVEDQGIAAVRSNKVSNQSSEEFYSLFLSWWEAIKKREGESQMESP